MCRTILIHQTTSYIGFFLLLHWILPSSSQIPLLAAPSSRERSRGRYRAFRRVLSKYTLCSFMSFQYDNRTLKGFQDRRAVDGVGVRGELRPSGHLDKFVNNDNTLYSTNDQVVLRPKTCRAIFYDFRRHKLKIKGQKFGTHKEVIVLEIRVHLMLVYYV
jgi:hypothetical protein